MVLMVHLKAFLIRDDLSPNLLTTQNRNYSLTTRDNGEHLVALTDASTPIPRKSAANESAEFIE